MGEDSFNTLSICSGGGGLDLGVALAEPDARVVCFVEHEAYALAVLADRIEEQALDDAPLWTDLRTFDGRPWRGLVDLVVGGKGSRPEGRAATGGTGADVGDAAHGDGRRGEEATTGAERKRRRRSASRGRDVADAGSSGFQVGARSRGDSEASCSTSGAGIGLSIPLFPPGPNDPRWRDIIATSPEFAPSRSHNEIKTQAESDVRGVVDGLAALLDRNFNERNARLRMLGNGVVPLQAAYAWRTLRSRFED